MVHARWRAARAAPARTRRRTTSRSASTRARSRTSRALRSCSIDNFLAVVAPKEYDAIQAAAQLKVVWKSDPKFGSGARATSGRGCARRATRTRSTRPATRPTPATSTRRSRGARRRCRRPTSTTTTASCRSARTPRSPTSATAPARRVYVQGQSLHGVPANLATMLGIGLQAREHPRDLCTRARARTAAACRARQPSRPRSSRRRSASRCACSGCAGTSTAGTATARPTCTTSRWASTRPARSSPPTGRATARPARHRHDQGAARHGHLAGGPGQRRPDPVRLGRLQHRLRTGGCWRRRSRCTGARSRCSALRAPNAPQSVLRQRADRGRARVRGEDGPDRVPPAEHRRDDDARRRAGCRCSTASTHGRGLEAEGRRVQPRRTGNVVTGRGFGFGTFASSQVGVVADIEVNKKTGQDRRQARLRRPEQRDHGQPRRRREPDERRPDPGPLAGAVRAAARGTRSGSRASTGSRTRSSASRTARRSRSSTSTRASTRLVDPGRLQRRREGGQHGRVQRRLERCPARASRRRSAIGSAVANAFFDATGVRIRQAPMNPATVRQVLKDAGAA